MRPSVLLSVASGLALSLGLAACAAASPSLAGATPPAVSPTPPPQDTMGTLFVDGSAQVEVPASLAIVSFAVETEAPEAASASAANAEAMDAVLRALRGLDSAPSVETYGYDLQPQYRRDDNASSPPRIVGYRVTNQLRATIDDVDGVGSVMDAAIGAGANRVTGLRFSARDLESARLEALRRAVAQARAQAEVIAEAMGMTLGDVLEVSGGASAPRPEERMMFAADMRAAPSTPIEAGSTRVTANVSVRYRLESPGR